MYSDRILCDVISPYIYYAARSVLQYGVSPYVCPIYRPLHAAAAGLLLWARRAGDTD